MKQLLINTELSEEKRIILLEDGLVVGYETELEGQTVHKGNIYKATVESVEPGLEAAFVKLPDDRNGFLPFRDIAPSCLKPAEGDAPIADRLSVGDSLLVQIAKEKRDNKGAVLTTFINLQGSYLILMPDQSNRNQVSRSAGREVREELQGMLEELTKGKDFALLLRTAGIECGIEDLRWDLEGHLLKLWALIRSAYEQQEGNALLYTEHNMPMKIVRDYFRKSIDQIVCDTASMYSELRALFEQVQPEYADRIHMHDSDTPLVGLKVEQQLRAVYSRAVSLPSGGQIVFDSTEALVAIDVNSSKGTKWSGIEETALQTNLQAAGEIARQLRLRDLSGLIVIDFIDMDNRESREQVQQRLSKEFRKDRARIRTTDISSLGLLELSRQRLRPSLDAYHSRLCLQCNGTGKVRSVRSAALDILRLIRESSMLPETAAILVHAPLDVSTYLLNEKRIEIRKLEDLYQTSVIILPDDKSTVSNYRVSQLSHGRKRDVTLLQKLSYKMAEEEDEKIQNYLAHTPDSAPPARPVVDNKMLPERREDQERKPDKNEKGVFGKVLDLLFGPPFGKEEGLARDGKKAEPAKDGRKSDPTPLPAGGKRRSRGGRKASGKNKQERRDDGPGEYAKGGQKAEDKDDKQSAQESGRKRGDRPPRRDRKPRSASDGRKDSRPAQQANRPKTEGNDQSGGDNGRGQDKEPAPAKPAPVADRKEAEQTLPLHDGMRLGRQPQRKPDPGLGSAGEPDRKSGAHAPAPPRQDSSFQQVETKTPRK